MNGDNEIEGLNIGTNGDYIDKLCGYADDIIMETKQNVYRPLSRCSKARGSSTGVSLVDLRLRLVSLFYSMKVPLKLKIKNTYRKICLYIKCSRFMDHLKT